MDLVRYDITPDFRKAMEPLILDALFEYGARHRTDPEAPMHLTVTQALEVMAAQQPRWREKLGKSVAALHLGTNGMSRKCAARVGELLRAAHEFFRREGAHTFRACSDIKSPEERFTMLWADYFSRGLLDWLREQELISHTDHLDEADVLVECAKLWVRDLAEKIPQDADPNAFFLDASCEVQATFQRGPVKLKVRGKPEVLQLRPVENGIELREYILGEPDHAELRIVQALLYMTIMEHAKGASCKGGSVIFFNAKRRHLSVASEGIMAEIDDAFDEFIGNTSAVRQLKLKILAARKSKPPQLEQNWLFIGAAGHGKTELARCAGGALGLPLVELHSASIGSVEDLVRAASESLEDIELKPETTVDAAGRTTLRYPPCMLFFDDAHGLRKRADALLPLLGPQRKLSSASGDAIFAGSSILAATTDASRLPDSFLACFRTLELEQYRHGDVARMVQQTFAQHSIELDDELARMIASIGRCNPMRARLYASELRDRHRAHPGTTPLTRETLMRLAHSHWKVDEHGLGAKDYQYLKALESGPKGMPALQQLLPTLSEEISLHLEPYLIQIGAVHRGARGRSLTVLGEQLLHRHRSAKA